MPLYKNLKENFLPGEYLEKKLILFIEVSRRQTPWTYCKESNLIWKW